MLLDKVVLRAVYSWQEALSTLLLLRCAIHDHLCLRVLLRRPLTSQASTIASGRGVACIALDFKGSPLGRLWHYLAGRGVHLLDIGLIESHVSVPARIFCRKVSVLLLFTAVRLAQSQDLVC